MLNHFNKLYEACKEDFDINEGLILTHPLHDTVSNLKRKFKITPEYKTNSFFLEYPFNTNPIIALEELEQILKLTNNYGYFPSFIIGKKEGQNFNIKYSKDNFKLLMFHNIIQLKFRFEAKFDVIEDNIPRYLYHLTPYANSIKILKQGLVPKSRSKAAYHPERVYLSKSKNNLYNLALEINSKLKINKKVKDWVILRIDTDAIPPYFNIYKDPNYIKYGYYSLNYISNIAIEVNDEFKIINDKIVK